MTRVSAPELPLPLFRTGKVRAMYAVGEDRLLMVASDRVSAFDVVMDEPVPGKGAVLTELSAFWFRKTADLVPNHLISDRLEDLPAAVQDAARAMLGRWLLVRRAERIDIECVVRGYLAGSAWAEYRRLGTVAGEPLAANLVESQRLARPIFTPAIKAESGHDENISRARLARMLGQERAQLLEHLSLRLYAAGAGHALSRGVILADTKFEFGTLDGETLLIDEALTPDSSRYWPADQYRPGGPQPSFDKQFLRDFLDASGWNKQPPPPRLPQHVIDGTADRYRVALARLTA
ncbi:MAG TPA: phosphoribosylaminoimidazolesuccinocarboxamide synthase [Chloroflexota bacterium]|nr:phosphoribosylaminoimidazolesuccinocarboxamide synthase [Chloroflexota bacterium]